MGPGRGSTTEHLVNGATSPSRPAPARWPLIQPVFGPLKSQKPQVIVTVTPLDNHEALNGNGVNGVEEVNGHHEAPKVNGVKKVRSCKPPKGPLIQTIYGPLKSQNGHVFVPPPLPIVANGVEGSKPARPRGPLLQPVYGPLKSKKDQVAAPVSPPKAPAPVNGVRAPKPARGPLIQPVYGPLKSQKGPAFSPPAPPPVESNIDKKTGKPSCPRGPQINPVYGPLKPQSEVYRPVPRHAGLHAAKKADEPAVHHGPLRTVSPPLALENHPLDQYPSIKAVIVGAGIAGLTAGILLQAKVPGLELIILEKNAEVGGIWNTNLYPGATGDEYSDVYQATFEPKTTWTSDYSTGAEIKEYWHGLASRFGIQKKIKFNHDVTEARWSKEKLKWLVSVRSNGVTRTEDADFLITATGLFQDPHHQRYPGIDNFLGHLRHASDWDPSFDPTGKRVALIGNDLSGLQLLPHLQKVVKHLDHYQEAPNVIPGQVHDKSDDWQHAPQDAKGYTKYRRNLEAKSYAKFADIMTENPSRHADHEDFAKCLTKSLKDRPELKANFQQDVSRSSNVTTAYLHALTQPNVSYVNTRISHITRKGIETQDGVHHPADAIILATPPSASSYTAAFPIFGPTDLNPSDDDVNAPATNLQSRWRPPGFPDTYLGLAAPEYPNLFFISGPNSTGAGSTTAYTIETQATYIAKVLRKVRTQGISTITPSVEATRDFRAYCESFFATTVLSADHRAAWYNGGVPGGRVLAFWPGSGVHASIARREPRWEDFVYTHRSAQANRFAYLGNGWSVKDVIAANLGKAAAEKVGFAGYLKEEAVGWGADLRSLHEEWWEA